MSVKDCRIVLIIFLAIAMIALPFGIVKASEWETSLANYERTKDRRTENISAELVRMESDDGGYTYKITLYFRVTNNTTGILNNLSLKTEVTDGKGNHLGDITTDFSKKNGKSTIYVRPGETVEAVSYVEKDKAMAIAYSDPFFEKLFDSGLTGRKTTTKVTSMGFAD